MAEARKGNLAQFLRFIFISIAVPMVSNAETIICSKFDHFGASSLIDNNMLGRPEEVSDWSPGVPFPDGLSKIVIAIPKADIARKFDCVERAEAMVPGVKDAIRASGSTVGHPLKEDGGVSIGGFSGSSLFGRIRTRVSYVRVNSLTVQIIISIDPEPVRSLNAIERYLDLPFGYCERNENCNVDYRGP